MSRGKVVISVVFIIMGMVFLFMGMTFHSIPDRNNSEAGSFGGNSEEEEKDFFCVVTHMRTENLGDTYQGSTAAEGYSYCRLHFGVTNIGEREYYAEAPSLYLQGENYDDVYEYWDASEYDDTEYLFEYDSQPYLPAGRTGKFSKVVEVRDSVTEIFGTYSPNYNVDDVDITIVIH